MIGLCVVLASCATVRRSEAEEAPKPQPAEAETPAHHGPRASVRKAGGVPALSVDGTPHNGMLRASFNPTDETRLFAGAGVDVFSFVTTASRGFWEGPMWVAPERFAFAPFDQEVRRFLELAPGARLLPRLEMSAPDWWRDTYPDDVVQIRGADGKAEPLLLPAADSHTLKRHPGIKRRTVPSWASGRWRKDTANAIRRLVAHAAQSDYADRIVGWHICSGASHEWFMWGNAIDVSAANVAAYRRWLRGRYNRVDVLRRAWAKPGVDFADAMPPTEEERARNPAGGSLRNPAVEQHVLDYIDYTSWMVADAIADLTRVAREATAGTKVVGAFYGYTFGLRGEPRQQCAGHHALQGLLDSPNIDFLASPHLYWHYRTLGTGTPAIMAPLDTLRLHGKLWYSETDIRTSLTGAQADWFQKKPEGIADDLLQQRRHLSWIVSRGLAHWWFDVSGIRYDHPDLRAFIKQAVTVAESAKSLDRSPVDEVAFVVDEGSVKYLNVGDPLGEDLLTGQLPALCRLGAPVGHYALHDVSRITDRELFLFGGILAPSRQARRDIDALKSGGRVLVFTYAPGLYRGGTWDEAAMEELTGIRIRQAAAPESLEATVGTTVAGFAPLNGTRVGVKRRVEPVFVPQDGDVDVIARFDDGRPAIVLKRSESWMSVFSAVPMLPAPLLATLAEIAGVHRYTDPGVALWASRDALAVSVDAGGPVAIRLPARRQVTDVWQNRVIGAVREFTVEIPERDSRLFFLR